LERDITDAELRLLIDSMMLSKHVPDGDRGKLIEKLEGLSNTYFKSRVTHIRSLLGHMPETTKLFYTIEILDEAISANKRVIFHFNILDVDKRLHTVEDEDAKPRKYEVSPYQMAAANGKYYLICAHEGADKLYHYRIDLISDIRLSDKKAAPLKERLDFSKHMAEHIYMFGGESVSAKFRAKRARVGDILDWFGSRVMFSEVTADCVIATVRVSEQAMLYWALQFGQSVEVLGPPRLREAVCDALRRMSEIYRL
jgi:predicted DNA-binding transcriptional regulator YafY